MVLNMMCSAAAQFAVSAPCWAAPQFYVIAYLGEEEVWIMTREGWCFRVGPW
jgi:hypothetical protein